MDKAFFAGIGGIGMSKLALLYKDIGFEVEGSDVRYSDSVKELEKSGIKIFIGHDAKHIDMSFSKFIYSSAIKENNPELIEAKKLGIPVFSRGKALAEIVNKYKSVVVSGTHGKTTTTSLIGHILKSSEFSANVYVGGIDNEFNRFDRNADYFVVESDESDGSFLYFNPDILIITNIDRDHLNHYDWSFDKLKESFALLASKSKLSIASMDDENAYEISKPYPHKYFGLNKDADMYAENIRYEKDGVYFEVKGAFGNTDVFLPLLGDKNISNALAALLAVSTIGINLELGVSALKTFKPPARRMELKGIRNGILIIDDHADHPTEIYATLSALKKHYPDKRLVAVYQPHRYSRVKMLGDEIARPFELADIVIVMEIYGAFEEPISGINGRYVNDLIEKKYPDKELFFAENERSVIPILKKILKKGDIVVLLGPGDIEELAPLLLKEL